MRLDEREDLLPVETELGSLLAEGYSRTRATELVIERTAAAVDAATVVLVEGLSDQIALEVIAARRARNFRDEGIAVVPMGGATNIRRFLAAFGPEGRNATLAGLYDEAQEDHIRRALERAGLPSFGFHMCVTDLEDELIRCLGVARLEEIVEAQGELVSFRRLQNEPFHRGREPERHLHRFISGHSGRKYRYARLMAESLDLAHVPAPIGGLLTDV